MLTWKNFRFVVVFAALALGACADLTENTRYSDLSVYELGKFHYNAGQYGLAVRTLCAILRSGSACVR